MKNKTILITGGSQGLGAELAKELSEQGANLIIIADSHAMKEYAEFRVRQDKEFIGDFEKAVKQVEVGEKSDR